MDSVAAKAYYDGSRTSQHVTLAGYIGPPEAWVYFDGRWREILARWACPFLHMREANALRGAFARDNGWSAERVSNLLRDLHNDCLAPMGWGEFRGRFVGASCTVNLPDYERARRELVRLREKEPEAICVDHVVTVAFMALPEDLAHPLGKRGTVELHFDKNEPFMHKVDRIWRSKPSRRPVELDLVSHVGTGDAQTTPGLQAADFLAWHTNRHQANPQTPDGTLALTRTLFATPNYFRCFDYAALVEAYGAEAK